MGSNFVNNYRRRRHFATKNPSFCYTFILKNLLLCTLLHPCTAPALESPHISRKLKLSWKKIPKIGCDVAAVANWHRQRYHVGKRKSERFFLDIRPVLRVPTVSAFLCCKNKFCIPQVELVCLVWCGYVYKTINSFLIHVWREKNVVKVKRIWSQPF